MEESKNPLKSVKHSRNEAKGAKASSSASSRPLKEAPAQRVCPKPATACRSKENITTAREDHKDQGSNRGTGRASTASPQDPGKPRRLTGRTSSGERRKGMVGLGGQQQAGQGGDARAMVATGGSPAGGGRDTGAGTVATSSDDVLTAQTKTPKMGPLKEKSPGALFYSLAT